MLVSLHIENIAVIRSLDLSFPTGFLALTGETGAGKSVITHAIGFALGAKGDKEMIRSGQNSASVYITFSEIPESVCLILSDVGFDVQDEDLIIQRSIFADGKTQLRIQNKPASVALLKEIAPMLLTMHGQTDTGELCDAAKHLEMLDLYADNKDLLSDYSEQYRLYSAAKETVASIERRQNERVRRMESLAYEIAEISKADLHVGEEEELSERKAKLRSSEKIKKNTCFVYKALRGAERASVSYLLDKSVTALSQISDVIPEMQEQAEKIREILSVVDEVAEEAYSAGEALSEEPEAALDSVESRLELIARLKRKYGITIEEILAYLDSAKKEYVELENADDLLYRAKNDEKKYYACAHEIGLALRTRRIKAAKEVETSVKETLEELDMPKVEFFTKFTEEKSAEDDVLFADGIDRAEFFISANLGAEPQPVGKIASGGELARIMLALKSAFAQKEGIPTVIFDEIDAGVSGKTARKIGIRMLMLSKHAQMICITHSAQIASLADAHLFVKKEAQNGETVTSASLLDEDGRISELSRILGGIHVTDAQKQAAADMRKEKDFYEKNLK